MPLVEIMASADCDDAAKARLRLALADAARRAVSVGRDDVGVTLSDAASWRSARDDAIAAARAFLDAMEARDLTAAKACLADGFSMTFPGGATMTTVEALVDWARGRYRFVEKRFERFEVASGETGPVVYCFGVLSGEWRGGRSFDGVRFIDRFATAAGKLTRQDVWNDLGEIRARERR